MKALVTGAAGFIGSNLIEDLVDDGYDVIAVDNFDVGRSRDIFDNPSVSLLEKDIRSLTAREMKTVDTVFHLAALANPRTCRDDFSSAFSVNVEGTFNVLSKAEIANVNTAVLMSSAVVYGEPDSLPINESDNLRGASEYASTKRMCEVLAETFNNERGLRTIIARPFNTYGPGQNSDYLIPTLIEQALEEGRIEVWSTKPQKDFVYIDDTTSALKELAESEDFGRQTFNIGTGNSYSVEEVANMIQGCVSHDVDVVDLDKDVNTINHLKADNTRLRSFTGWEPEYPIQVGLKETVESYLEDEQVEIKS